jgi:hypothetical protein
MRDSRAAAAARAGLPLDKSFDGVPRQVPVRGDKEDRRRSHAY